MNKEKFERDMAVFSFRQHQDFVTWYKALDRLGYTVDDVENYIEMHRTDLKTDDIRRNPPIPCPECDAPMIILPVNDSSSTRTGDDAKSVMMCQNKDCMYTDYSIKSVGGWIKELSKK